MKQLFLMYDLDERVVLGACAADDRYEAPSGALALLAGDARLEGGARCDAKAAFEIYALDAARLTRRLTGSYSLAVVDPENGALMLYQDALGGPRPMYFACEGRRLIVSGSMKKLITCLKQRGFDEDALKIFLERGVILNESTLVRGVHKLPLKARGEIDLVTGDEHIFKARYAARVAKGKPDCEQYLAAFDDALMPLAKAQDRLCCALSGGYDSNLIASRLASLGREVEAFSVGGSVGVNETGIARRLAKVHGIDSVVTALVDEETLQSLPDIVFQLEGAVYERGIFLQYALSRLVEAAGAEAIFMGEGADQVLNLRYGQWGARLIPVPGHMNPFDMLGAVILRKNRLMMEGAGIRCLYPYLEPSYVCAARSLRFDNGISKKFHKAAVRRALGPERARLISKVGGSTQLSALFTGDVPFDTLKSRALKNGLYKKGTRVRDCYGALESEMDYCLKLAYACLFEQIFLSGKYDAMLGNGRFTKRLTEMLPEDDGKPCPALQIRPKSRLRRLASCALKSLRR